MIRSYDNSGIHTTASEITRSIFTVLGNDTVDPVSVIVSPVGGSNIAANGSVEITGTVSENQSRVDRLLVRLPTRGITPRMYWNGDIVFRSALVWPAVMVQTDGNRVLPDVDLSAVGEYQILLRAFDAAGNQATSRKILGRYSRYSSFFLQIFIIES